MFNFWVSTLNNQLNHASHIISVSIGPDKLWTDGNSDPRDHVGQVASEISPATSQGGVKWGINLLILR